MISLWIVFAIIVIHFIADFIAQTDYQAKNKSNNNIALTQHTANYSLCWLIPIWFISGINFLGLANAMIFVLITFICHTITDYFTSRLNSRLAIKAQQTGNYHNFFVSVGFDQVLHYIQLFFTYYILIL